MLTKPLSKQDKELVRDLWEREKRGDLKASETLARLIGDGWCHQCGKRIAPELDMCFKCEMGDYDG